jgi:hypothetical protein
MGNTKVMEVEAQKKKDADANRDPLSGEPGAHPLGAGVGAVGGATTGAVVGAMAGPVGVVVGAAVGGLAGGLVGKGVAEAVDPTVEDAYWSKNYSARPYVTKGHVYELYRPAYQYGWESHAKYLGRRFDEIEADLARDWDTRRGKSTLAWDRAKLATRDAWDHIDQTATKVKH